MNIAEEIRNFRAEGISAEGAAKLAEAARRARMWAVVATSAAKSGHPAGALSSMDIYMTLLGAANVSPELADSPERDRIVVSHGHTSAGFYAARFGDLSLDLLAVAHDDPRARLRAASARR